LFNPLNISEISGGKRGRKVLAAIKSMGIYLMITLILILELLEPLTTDDSYQRLKDNQGVQLTFAFMTIITPLIVMIMLYFFNMLDESQRKSSKTFMMVMSTIFLLLQFSLTIAALVIGEAYLDEDDTNRRAKKRGFLYTKVIILFICKGFALWNGFTQR
jgi:hypothetical protein